ncbi:phospholipase domain-containing protein [Streptomyces sp. NPDC057027]|uniref:phospholipase domain-containing protein n=1 Tax=Streptomyces sp. NPDC057027 TaxID=3346004 RepID=UPI0036445DD5
MIRFLEELTGVQEPGTRPARPLPYQPDASATTGDGSVTVALGDRGRASAHFALYPYAGEFAVPQHQDVRGEGEWTVPVPGDHHRFTITGPNGFRPEFEGPAPSSPRGSTTTTSPTGPARLVRRRGDRTGGFRRRLMGHVENGRPSVSG